MSAGAQAKTSLFVRRKLVNVAFKSVGNDAPILVVCSSRGPIRTNLVYSVGSGPSRLLSDSRVSTAQTMSPFRAFKYIDRDCC